MYDAIEDPYTYKNSTVLVNKLDLRNQVELDAFEAEISSARAEEPLPEGSIDFEHYKAIHHHLFQDVYQWAGQVRTVRIAKVVTRFVFPKTSKGKRTSCSTTCDRRTTFGISMRKHSRIEQHISWQS
jgi:cell filamentation protein